MESRKLKKNHKIKSQILLIAIMILATVMTIVLSLAFQSTTETQITKLEEENQKALAAAESAIEVLLKEATRNQVSFSDPPLTRFGNEFTGQAQIDNSASRNFLTPSLKADESYTFYLAEYNLTTNTFSPSIPQDIRICFSSSQGLEITLLKNNSIKRYVVDANTQRIENRIMPLDGCPGNNQFSHSFIILSSDIGNDSRLMIIKNLFSSGRIYFEGSSSNLPTQGKRIVSTATTRSGVTKKITLFQSYPQIIGDFFYTRF